MNGHNGGNLLNGGDIKTNTRRTISNGAEVITNGGGKTSNGGYEIINEDLYGDELNELYIDNAESNLHGYNKTSHGCGTPIQLENPDKKEALV